MDCNAQREERLINIDQDETSDWKMINLLKTEFKQVSDRDIRQHQMEESRNFHSNLSDFNNVLKEKKNNKKWYMQFEMVTCVIR